MSETKKRREFWIDFTGEMGEARTAEIYFKKPFDWDDGYDPEINAHAQELLPGDISYEKLEQAVAIAKEALKSSKLYVTHFTHIDMCVCFICESIKQIDEILK